MNFPLSCQRQTRTKDTGCLQEPLWMQQGRQAVS
jgi:hypothetical protein